MDLKSVLSTSPALLPVLLDCAATAMELYHQSPVDLTATILGSTSTISIAWDPPDPRVATTYQQERITEDGAVAIAMAILPTGWKVLKVAPRRIRVNGKLKGTRVDYLLGDTSGRLTGVLEVGGRACGSLSALMTAKAAQVEASPYAAIVADVYAAGCVFEPPEAELRKA